MNRTKRKFLASSAYMQHKECVKLLRAAYDCLHTNSDANKDLDTYLEISSWMNLPALPDTTLKTIADRYHSHAKHASIQHKEHRLLPQVRTGDKTIAEAPWNIAIYLDNIRSAHNVGSILRTTEAFSLGSVFFSHNTPFATHKQVKDAAMGAEQWITCHQDTNAEDLPKPLVAMETASNAISLYDFQFPETFTLAVGNEEYGCSEHTLKHADAIIEIPLRGRKNSLNVANAFAIAAAEIVRQRRQTYVR